MENKTQVFGKAVTASDISTKPSKFLENLFLSKNEKKEVFCRQKRTNNEQSILSMALTAFLIFAKIFSTEVEDCKIVAFMSTLSLSEGSSSSVSSSLRSSCPKKNKMILQTLTLHCQKKVPFCRIFVDTIFVDKTTNPKIFCRRTMFDKLKPYIVHVLYF